MRTVRLATVLLAAALVAPAPALAHSGLTQRQNLPIPQVMFAVAATAVLCVSFVALAVLWATPRLQEPRWRPLPIRTRAAEGVCGAIGVGLLVLVIVGGYAGPQ